MGKRLLMFFLAIALLGAVAAEFILPQATSLAVAQGMTELVGSSEIKAQVIKRPAVAMVTGGFDQITVDAANAKIDKIIFRQLKAELKDVQLDRQRLYLNRQAVIEQVGEVNVLAVLTQEEVARYLNQQVKGVKNATVSIDQGKMTAQSSFVLGGFATVAVGLEGRVIQDGQIVKFVTDRFLLNNSPVGSIGGIGLAEIPLLDMKKLPFGVTVRDIMLEQGKLTLHANNKVR